MAWLLIRAFSDAAPTAWKLGDIVEVRPDEFSGWGALECPPRYYRVQVTGLDAVAAKTMLEKADDVIDPGTGRVTQHVRDRFYQVQIADMPQAWQDSLASTGQLVITKKQAASYVRGNDGQLANLG